MFTLVRRATVALERSREIDFSHVVSERETFLPSLKKTAERHPSPLTYRPPSRERVMRHSISSQLCMSFNCFYHILPYVNSLKTHCQASTVKCEIATTTASICTFALADDFGNHLRPAFISLIHTQICDMWVNHH